MMISTRKSHCVFPAMLLLAISLLSSCQPAKPRETAAPFQDAAALTSHRPDRSVGGTAKIRETRDPADYDVLRDAKNYLHVDNGTLNIYLWRIESFDFLSEFENIKTLIISECYIPQGVTIPRMDALNDVVEIEMYSIYGSGAADVLSDCLPLPKLDRLYLSGDAPSKSALPAIPSLTDIFVSVPDALHVISNNTHITGALCFEASYDSPGVFSSFYEDFKRIDGIENFSSIQFLRLPHSAHDISPVASCAKLRFLDASASKNVDSLKPLYGLNHLEEIIISEKAYNALPEEERKHFTPKNNGNADAVHVYVVPEHPLDYAEGEALYLSEQTIKSFDFLSEYPNLKYLAIVNCDIADGLVLPKIDTLTDLIVIDPNALEIIENNTQLAGRLEIGRGYVSGEDDPKGLKPLSDLDGLEAFTSLETLIVEAPVNDISALSGCRNLRRLSLVSCTSINTLKPLYGLSRLRELYIDPTAYRMLPQEDRERFNFENNKKPYMTHIGWRD